MRFDRLILVLLIAGTALPACLKSTAGGSASAPTPLVPPIVETLDGEPLRSHDFGPTVIGNRLEYFGAVRNANAVAAIVTVTGLGDAGPFALEGLGGIELQPGDRVLFQLAYVPSVPGAATATAQVAFPDGPGISIELTGSAIEPACDAVPTTPVDLGTVSIGATTSADVFLFNPLMMNWPLRLVAVSGPDAAAFSTSVPPGEIVLPANAQYPVAVQFAPRHEGSHAAALEFALPGACGTRSIPLSGKGLTSVIECARDFSGVDRDCSIDFGYVGVNGVALRQIVFRNLGTTDVALRPGAVDEPAGSPDLFLTHFNRDPVTLPAGGAPISFEFSFRPTAIGDQVGSFSFTTSDPGRPSGSVSLRGHGGTPAFEVEPTSISFGKTRTNFSVLRHITVRNPSDATSGETLKFGSFVGGVWTPAWPSMIDSSDFQIFPPSPPDDLSVAPGGSLDFSVNFSPTTSGPKIATLRFRTNVNGGTDFDVELRGEAIAAPACNLEVRPTSVNFGTMDQGLERTLNLVLVNTATASADACIVSVTPSPTSTVYALPQGAIDQAVVPGGQSISVPVQLLPRTADGTFTDQITVEISSDSNSVIHVPVTGEVRGLSLFISETDVDFHTVGTNCASGNRVIRIWDNGTSSASTRIDSIAFVAGSSPSFTWASLPTLPRTVTGATPLQIGITYRPTSAGEDYGAVLLTSAAYPSGIVIALHGSSATDPIQTDVFALAAQSMRDVILVIDDGCSMYDKQQSMARNMPALLATATSYGVDYKIAIMRPSDDGTANAGRFLPTTGAGPCFTGPSMPPCTIGSGTGSIGEEALLRAPFLALSRPNRVGWNAGFLRDDAGLSVIVLSDAADNGPRVMPVTFYEDFFLDLKTREHREQFSLSGFIPTLATAPIGCSYDSFDAGLDPRTKGLITATDGISEEICETGQAIHWQELSERVFGPPLKYYLLSPPDMTRTQDPLEVKVDGMAFPATGPRGETRWQYDASRNALTFDRLAAPGAGSTLTISYRVKCL